MNRLRSALVMTMMGAMMLTACSSKSGQTQSGGSQNTAPSQSITAQKQKETKKMNTKVLTKEEFKAKLMDYEANPSEWKYKGDKPAVIDFYATWCGPCKQTAPIVEELAGEYEGKIDFYKVDVDQQEELAALFGVQSIPTILFIPMQGQPQKTVGAMGKGQFEDIIKQVILK